MNIGSLAAQLASNMQNAAETTKSVLGTVADVSVATVLPSPLSSQISKKLQSDITSKLFINAAITGYEISTAFFSLVDSPQIGFLQIENDILSAYLFGDGMVRFLYNSYFSGKKQLATLAVEVPYQALKYAVGYIKK